MEQQERIEAPKVVLLDLMGTVIHEVFFSALPQFFGMSLEEMIELKEPGVWVDFEKGLCEQKVYLDRFFKDGRAFDHDAFLAHVQNAYTYIDGMELLIAELSERVPIHILSNYPKWYELVEARLEISRYAKWSFVSCHTGVRKPDPEAYLGPAKTLGLEPGECLFIDDREDNCEAALAVGMPAIRFVDPEALRNELSRFDLLR